MGIVFLGKFLWQKLPVSKPAQCFLEPPRHQLQQKPDVLLAMDRSDLPKSRFSNFGAVSGDGEMLGVMMDLFDGWRKVSPGFLFNVDSQNLMLKEPFMNAHHLNVIVFSHRFV